MADDPDTDDAGSTPELPLPLPGEDAPDLALPLEPAPGSGDDGEEPERDDDAAIARAEALLDGPGLRPPAVRPDPAAVEATWPRATRAALRRLRRDLHRKRVGLAISGGGSLGSFEAGALRFLYDHTAVAPVVVSGNSAGALNAAKLAEGDPPGGPRAIDEVERIWRSLRITPDMWEPEPWLTRLQASAAWANSLRDHIDASDGGATSIRVAVRVLGGIVRRPPETDGTLDAVRDALRAQSLLSLAPVADLLARELHPGRVAASGIALRVGIVGLESGELRYVTETGALHDRTDRPLPLPPVPLGEGVLASASIPVAFPPVLLHGEHYVDGGAREILPLELLAEHHDVDRVIAVAAGATGVAPVASFRERNLLDIMRRVSAEIGPDETLRKELAPPGGWRRGVRLVAPEFDVHDSMTIDPALIAISLDHGWLRAADVLLELGPECRALTRSLTEVRMELRRLAGPLPRLFDDRAPDPGETGDPDALTTLLRTHCLERRRLGGPLPPSLEAWLDG